ncbi:MAG TPA: hypothetical protein VKY81_02005 [Natronosporangium sp.]|nr:hypothetical protein [Natronosporangium sp.]
MHEQRAGADRTPRAGADRTVGTGGPAGDAGSPGSAATPVEDRTTDITAGPGGVMTDEVGVVTGELTLRTERFPDGEVVVRVQYRDAAEWYTVTGGRTRLVDPADLDAVHAVAVGLLDRPHG